MEAKKDSVKIKLKYPLENGEDKLSELTATRPKGKHLKKLPIGYFDNPEAKLEGIVPFVCFWLGITIEQFDEMDGEDVFVIMEAMASFLTVSPATGKN